MSYLNKTSLHRSCFNTKKYHGAKTWKYSLLHALFIDFERPLDGVDRTFVWENIKQNEVLDKFTFLITQLKISTAQNTK